MDYLVLWDGVVTNIAVVDEGADLEVLFPDHQVLPRVEGVDIGWSLVEEEWTPPVEERLPSQDWVQFKNELLVDQVFNEFYASASASLPAIAALLLTSLEKIYSERVNFLAKLKVLSPTQAQLDAFATIAEQYHLSTDFVAELRSL